MEESRTNLEILHCAEGNAVGLFDGRVLVFVRSRALTGAALDVIEGVVGRLVATGTADRPIGALAVLPGEAGLSRKDLLARQKKIFGPRFEHVWVALCVIGDTPQTVAMRAVVRLFTLGRDNMKMHSRPEAAIVWLCGRLGLHAKDLGDAVDSLRHASHRDTPSSRGGSR